MIKDITGNKLDIKSDKVAIVVFTATWCKACHEFINNIENNNFGDDVKIYNCDVDKNDQLSDKFSVTSLPALVIFRYGKVYDTAYHAISMDELNGYVDEIINP